MFQFGNKQVKESSVLKLCQLAGNVGEDDDEDAALFVKFTKENYTRAEVIQLLELITEIEPDECFVESDDDVLRLWWD